jgi:hypothetical protein
MSDGENYCAGLKSGWVGGWVGGWWWWWRDGWEGGEGGGGGIDAQPLLRSRDGHVEAVGVLGEPNSACEVRPHARDDDDASFRPLARVNGADPIVVPLRQRDRILRQRHNSPTSQSKAKSGESQFRLSQFKYR